MGSRAPAHDPQPRRSDAACSRRSLVPVTGEVGKSLDQIRVPELPATIELLPGKVTIYCQNMEHLLQQLVQLAKTLDNDYETLQQLIERAPARRPVGSETASTPVKLRGDSLR
jgi:hypothetical protein